VVKLIIEGMIMKFNKQKDVVSEVIAWIIIISIAGAGIFGWVNNIIQLCHAGALSTFTGIQIARIVGIFVAPLGIVLGYF
jgi:hypothetical protein